MRGQLEAADTGLVEQTEAACCYARSDKYWVTDPQGVAWETFHTFGASPVYGEDIQTKADPEPGPVSSACCAPELDSIHTVCCPQA